MTAASKLHSFQQWVQDELREALPGCTINFVMLQLGIDGIFQQYCLVCGSPLTEGEDENKYHDDHFRFDVFECPFSVTHPAATQVLRASVYLPAEDLSKSDDPQIQQMLKSKINATVAVIRKEFRNFGIVLERNNDDRTDTK